MKILLLGRNGQVGWELQRQLPALGEVVALGSSTENGLCGDLRDVDGLRATVRAVAPDVIVNAGAYTAVDKAESEPEAAMAVNGIAPGILAEEAKRLGAWLVHYSTDYVFDGSGSVPWKETDPTGPLNVYGHTKLAGEQAIQAAWEKHLIFRTSWVHGGHGSNFVRSILRLAQAQQVLRVVGDQTGAPTSAVWLAQLTRAALSQSVAPGLYHATSAGAVSWHGFASEIIDFARDTGMVDMAFRQLIEISTHELGMVAARPLNSRLDCSKLISAIMIPRPYWRDELANSLRKILQDK